MAGNKQRFTYEINADIGQAKKAIDDLQRSIDNLSKKQISTNYLDTGINKAVNSAKELQYHLNKALNADTGKLNLNAFSQSLAQSNLSAKDLMQNLLQGGATGQQAFTSLAGVIAQSEVPLKRMNSTLKNFATTLKNTVKWEISSAMIHGLERSLRGAVSYAKNLNTSLTNIRIVTGQSVDDMARFAKEANVAAKALSTTTKSYTDASLIYYQQGDSQEMAAKKAAITIKAANASFETSAKEMSEYLTAVWNSYQVGADELERYVDIMASLGAKTATSLEEIATSMQKVAATANTVGVSMEQVSSIIATVSSVTRESAESIGTSYKTIFARIGDLKLGKVDEDGVGLGQVSSQLDAIGVKILDESGNLREMGDIIVDLGTKWQTMNQAQKTAVAQVVAGKRQYTQLMALFENWPMYMQNMQIAESSEGALQKMQDTYAESWQAASDKVKASLESIYGQIFKDQTIIKLMDNTSSLIETIDKVIQGFGGIGGVLKTLGALSITVFKTQIGNSINQVLKNIKMFVTQFKGQNILQIGQSLSSGSAKNVEQLQLQARTKEWSNLFSSMKSTNEVEQIALQNSTSLLSAKDQLIAAEHKLTQAQKDRAVFTLEQLSQEQSKLLAVAQERQALAQQSISNRKSDYLKVTTAIVNNDNVTRQSAQNTLNNVYQSQGGYEGALKKYEEHTYANTAAFNIKSTLQSTNDVQAAIQQTKKSLSKYIDSKYLDDATLDAKTLIGLLDQVIRKTNRANKRMYDKARSIPGKYAQEQARAGFDNSQARGEEKYNVDSQMTGLQRSVTGIKSTFTQLLNPASEASKTLGSALAKVAGTTMSVAGAMSSAGSMVRTLTEDTVDLTSVLSNFSGVAMNLAMGFSTGGIWGLVATVLATTVGAISEILKIRKEEYQEKQTKDFEKTVEETDKKDKELSNIKTLIKNYNTLKETYTSTGEGQDALAKSARELAEAYGLVGTSLLIAEGNFSQFESAIISSLGLGKIKAFYQSKIDETNKALMDQSIDSAYRMKAQSRDMKTQGQAYNFTEEQNQVFRDQAALFSPETVGETERKIARGKNIQTAIDSLIVPLFDMPELIGTNTFSSDNWAKLNQASIAYLSQGLGTQGLEEANKIMHDIARGIPVSLAGGKSKGQILEEYPDLMQYHRGILVNSQIEALTAGSNPSYITPEDMKALEILFQGQINQSIAAQQKILRDEFVRVTGASYDKEQDGLMGIDYLARLMTNNKFDPYNYKGGPVQWYSDRETAIQEVQEEEAAIRAELEKKELDPILKDWYNARLEELGVVKSYLDNLGDQDYLEAYNASQDWQKQLNDLENIENLIVKKMFGHSEQDTPFTDFFSYMEELEKDVEAMAVQDDRFAGLVDPTTGKALEGKEDQFNAVKDQIAAGYISDLTAFDDFLAVYQAIADTFSSEQMPQVQAFIDAANIKDARLISSNLLNTMLADIKNGQSLVNEQGQLVEGTDTSKILAYNQKLQAADESKARYDSFININSKFKENLGLDDSIALYELLIKNFDDGNNAWADFVQMDYDQKKAYLESREDTFLSLTKSSQQSVVDSAKLNLQEVYGLTEQEIKEILTGTNAKYTDRKAVVDSFVAAGFSLDKETNTYIDRNDQVYDAQKFGGKTYNEMLSEQSWVTGVGSIIEEITSAEKIIQAIIMMEGAIPGLSTQIQTLVTDFEKFNKTGKVSADVIQKMAKWGIDGSKIKTVQDYLKVMKSIYTQAKTNASTAEQNYLAMVGDNEYDWSNEQVQKDHPKEFIAWQEMMKLKQIEYDTEEQYNTAKQSDLDSELTKNQQILAQMREKKSLAEEEASKTQQLAEYMTAALESGKLSEAARVGMDPELLAAWDSAANATERGAVAVQAWSKYATQMSLAGEDLNTLYNNASNALNALINNQGRYGLSDLINFNFADSIKGKSDFAEFISQQVKDPAAQAIWNEGFESLISHTNISSMSDLDILTAVKDEIIKAGNITEKEFDKILAGIRDSIASTFEQLAQYNMDTAQKAADAWLEAFNTVAEARKTLFEGGSLIDQLAGDPKKIQELFQNFDGTWEEFTKGIIEGTIKAEDLSTPEITESYLQDRYVAAGVATLTGSNEERRIEARKLLEAQAKPGETVSDDTVTAKVAQDYETAIKGLVEQGLINMSDDQIKADAMALAKGKHAMDDALLAAINEYLSQAQERIDFSEQLRAEKNKQEETAIAVQNAADTSNLVINASGAIQVDGQTIEGSKTIGLTREDGQVSSYEEYQKLQEAIERAQEAKYSGKSWESLSAADQDLLKQYNIDFDNVDTSAQNCADALAACAQAAYTLAEQALLAEGTGYTKEDGKYYYTTEDGIKTEVTAENNEAIKALQEAQNFADNAAFKAKDTDYQTMERMASSVGMTIDEFEALKKSIEDADDSMTLAEKDINEVARATAKASQGLKELKDDFDENAKTLKNADKHSNEYIKAMSKMRKQLSDIFDTDEKFITDDFVEENIENMEKMAKGTEEEAKAAAEAISDNLVKQIFEMENIEDTKISVGADTDDAKMTISSFFTDFMDQYDNVEIGTHIDTGPAIDALNTILSTGKMTADQVSAALAAIGWEPTIEWQYFDAEDNMVATSSTQYRVGETIVSGSGTQTLFTKGMYAVPVIKGTTKKGTGASAPKSGGGKKGGGGGGSDKKETKDKIRGRDEIERYHKQNDTLDRISSTLAGIDKLKDRVYGKDHIAQIEAETDALNKQLIAQQDLHDEALKWMAADKADLTKYGAEYDENGTIVNYERVMERIIDEYNSAIERYNNSEQGDGDKLALEAAEQIFEDAKKAIENYEEALGIANDSANEMLEIQNQMSELEVEKITYELELKMEMNERDLEMLEYYQEKYSEELENQDKLFNTFIQSAAEYEDNLAQLGKAYEDLSRQYAAGLINEAHYAEAVTELQEEIVDNLNSLQEIQSELAEAYSETLELAREEIERTTDAIDHSNEALQSFMDITRLTGNDAEYKKIGKFYDQMYANNLTKIEVQKAHLDSLLEEEERFQEKIRNGQQLTELEKSEYAALSEQIQETRDTLLSSVVESLEVVRESYENTINSIADDLDNFMAGAAGSMEYLQEQYGYFQEEQERYVSTTKELYEVSKLNRDIEGTLAITTSSAAKEALKALQEKINKQSELNELTEYDIEMNQLQYQLLLARIKLEESQNAKDTVRLTRDENGNYAYRYTANQDKIDEAAQHYEDVLQQINDTTVQRTSEIEQQLLNTMSNYKEKFQEIATDYSLTEEERLMRLEELNNQFSETMRYLQEQNNIVTNNLTANQEAIAGHYGATMSEITASTAGNVNNTIQSMIDKTEEYIAAMNNAIFGEEGAQSAWQKYLAQLGDIEGSADVAYDSLLGSTQEMGEMNGFAAEEALEVIQTLRDTLDPLEALSSAWDAHNAILEATISNYENLAQVIQGALSAIGQIPNGGTANVDGTHRYAKGGLVDYTGLAWVDGTASDPEMMLNPGDTQNILKATAMVKSLDSGFIGSLVESVKSAAAAMLHMFGGAYHAVTNVHTANDSALDQNVHITAEFPNVQNHTEIEEAFDNLINQAAQFAHRKN